MNVEPSSSTAGDGMHRWIVRYPELRPCTTAFIDTRTPGSHLKENFTIIGPGVSESPDQYVHIREPHGFNIGAARQPPGCVNSQHSHETAEVFIVHSGQWEFTLGPDANDGAVRLGPGDTISIPIHVFRGFRNVGEDTGFLFAVLGKDDPGHVTWAPYVFEAAREHGLVLLEDGTLIDTKCGEKVPEGARLMHATTADDVARLRHMTGEELLECVMTASEIDDAEAAPLNGVDGITETAIIGAERPSESMPAGKMTWEHGFHVRRLRFDPAASSGAYCRNEHEVVLMQDGELTFEWSGGSETITAGDVITVPVSMAHEFVNNASKPAIAYVVRGGDRPGVCTAAAP